MQPMVQPTWPNLTDEVLLPLNHPPVPTGNVPEPKVISVFVLGYSNIKWTPYGEFSPIHPSRYPTWLHMET